MRLSVVTVLSAVGVVIGCNPPRDVRRASGTIEGRAVKGPVGNATVTVKEAMSGYIVAEGSTDADGAFSVDLGTDDGDFVVCVSGGGFTDEATGLRVELGANQMCAPVLDFAIEETRRLIVTPWTHLVTNRAASLVRYKGKPYGQAARQAASEVDTFMTCGNPDLALLDADPIDPTATSSAGLELTPALLSGICLGGLSHMASEISISLGLTPGVAVTPMTLTTAFGDDLYADGVSDGIGSDGVIDIQGHILGPDGLRGGGQGQFPQGIRGFLGSSKNATSIRQDDLQTVLVCMTMAEGGMFPDGGGGELDAEGPGIWFDAPAEGDSVAGTIGVQVRAEDQSDIEDLWLEDGPGIGFQELTLDGHQAHVVSSLDTTELPDGSHILRARSVDVLGNTSELELGLDINNNAPVITVETPAFGETVRGTDVAVTVRAHDPQQVASLKILEPGLVDTNPAVEVFEAVWDTTHHSDGEAELVFEATDFEGNSATGRVRVTVDNLNPGAIEVSASMDTPVEDMTIEILAVEPDGSGGAVLASNIGSETGSSWTGVLPDTYSGPILVRGYGTASRYTNAATGEEVSFAVGEELLLLTEYVPTPEGTVLSDLSLTALSTFGADAALARWGGMSPSEAIALGNRLAAEHVQRPELFDLITTPASDFTDDPVADAHAAQKVGLIHAGLSQLGLEWALEASLPPTAFPSIRVLGKLREDLQDGVFDGLNAGEVVHITSQRDLTTNTFRSGIALAIVNYLESDANQTSLEAGHFTQQGGMLELMATNTSELFGPEAPENFDVFGPGIEFDYPALGQAVSGIVDVEARAWDPSNVTLMLGYVDYQVSAALGSDRDSSAGRFLASLNTTLLADGPHTLRMVATDSRDNLSIKDLAIVVDNSPPEVAIEAPGLTGVPSVVVTGTVGDPDSGVATLEIWVNDGAPEVTTDPGDTINHLAEVPCNANSEVHARAANRAGVVSATATVTVACDDRAPGLALLESTYLPRSSIGVEYDPASERLLYLRRDGAPVVSLHTLDWLSSPGPLIEKYGTRWDRISFRGITIESNNLPYLAIVPDDFVTAGTVVGNDVDAMLVRYRYWFQGVPRTDWIVPEYSDSGSNSAFILPFSYQDLGVELADPIGTEQHRISVEMTDQAGNVSVAELYFQVQTASPPIVVVECNLGRLEDLTLENDRLSEWFGLDHPSFFSGRLVFPRLPAGTMFPWTYTVAIPPVAVSFQETLRQQKKTNTEYVPCSDYDSAGWCTTANSAAGTQSSCWVNEPNKEMHRYMWGTGGGGNLAGCDDGFWSDGPSTTQPTTMASGTFSGQVDGIPLDWSFDSVISKWEVPVDDYLAASWYQPVAFRMRTVDADPELTVPDLENSMWLSTKKHGGGWAYLVRSHVGVELIRQWGPHGNPPTDFHYSRNFRADEYIAGLSVSVPAVVPEVTIDTVGPVPVLYADGTCGVDLTKEQTE